MSTVTGPFTITPGGAGSTVVLPQPQSAQGQMSQLVLDNLSTYILEVHVGVNVYYQAPLVESAYNLVSVQQPVVVHAIPEAGDVTTSGTLAPTWMGQGEEIKGIWPIALSGPAEVAAAVAAALLANGIPNVLTSVPLITAPVTAPGGTVATFDVHQYASVEANLTANLDPTRNHYGITILFANDALGTNIVKQYSFGDAPGIGGWQDGVVLPVVAPWLIIGINSGNPADSVVVNTLIGTNRSSGFALVSQTTSSFAAFERTALTENPFSAGTEYGITTDWSYWGECMVVLSASDTDVQGVLTMQYAEGGGGGNIIEVPIISTDELTLASPGSLFVSGTTLAGTPTYARSGQKTVYLPPTGRGLYFKCTAPSAASATIEIDIARVDVT